METAPRFYDAVHITFAKIARRPGIGELHQSSNPRLAGLRITRVEGFEKHLIFYRTGDQEVDIVRVLHGARDVDRVLSSA